MENFNNEGKNMSLKDKVIFISGEAGIGLAMVKGG